MNWFEFILIFFGMLIVGIWGLIIIAYKCGLLEEKDTKKKNK